MAQAPTPQPQSNIPIADSDLRLSLAWRQYFLKLDNFIRSVTAGFTVDDKTRFLIGLSTALTSGTSQFLSVENAGTGSTVGGCYGLFQFSNDASSSFLGFYKTRATVKGSSTTAVQNADGLGEINFNGADGTNYVDSMYIDGLVDGAVSAGIVPTALAIGNMNSAGILFERMRLTSDGNLNIIGAFATNTPRFISSATYTTNTTDASIIFNGSGCTVTLTVPPAPVFAAGRWLFVKTLTNNAVVSASSNVAPLAGGALSTSILSGTAGQWAILQYDSTNWNIMAAN